MFKRITLFLITNLAIVFVLSIVLNLLGVGPMLDQQGLNMGSLITIAAVFGFGGSLISLAISKWTAKRMTGAVVITNPANELENWLVETVRRQAGRLISACRRWRSTMRPMSTPLPPA